jgi:hypothetical protein
MPWRLLRWFLRFMTTVSLSLCILFTALWIRSYWKADFFFRVSEVNWTHFTSSRGKIEVYWKTSNVRRFGPQKLYHAARSPYDLKLAWKDVYPAQAAPPRGIILGYGAMTWHSDTSIIWEVLLPDALPVLLLAMAPAASLLRWNRRRLKGQRMRLGLCLHCGYDLRASPERCPECGQPVISPRAAPAM